MPIHNMKAQAWDMHSDEWWMKVWEGDLTVEESRLWEAHLAQCAACRQEWEALTRVEDMLRVAPPLPAMSAEFSVRVVEHVVRRQRLKRLLTFLGGLFVIAFIAGCVLLTIGPAFFSVERLLLALYTARHLLFGALVRTVVGLLSVWEMVVPLVILVSGLGFLLLMPNSILATVALFWFSRRRKAEVVA